MKKYEQALNKYGSASEELNTLVIELVLNVVVDKVGNLASETHFTKGIDQLRKSVLYRLSSLGWHLQNLCRQHDQFEQAFRAHQPDSIIMSAKNIQFFIFDDFIFNLISLYDYYANLIAYFLIGENKKKIGWQSLAKAARDKKNRFSTLSVAGDIATHENYWVKRIRDFRAELIHYNLNMGNDQQRISGRRGEDVKFELLYSVPEKLAKKLDLQAPVHKGVGIDLQLGAIEIGERSINWLASLTDRIRSKFTKNSVQRV